MNEKRNIVCDASGCDVLRADSVDRVSPLRVALALIYICHTGAVDYYVRHIGTLLTSNRLLDLLVVRNVSVECANVPMRIISVVYFKLVNNLSTEHSGRTENQNLLRSVMMVVFVHFYPPIPKRLLAQWLSLPKRIRIVYSPSL